MTQRVTYDVCVVGGGPAGLMAAGTAAREGANVVLIEKNRTAGRKLLITGGGRCNVTNEEPDPHRLVAKYGSRGNALYSVFARFSSADMRDFLSSFGVATKVEDEGRVFPATEQASSIREALLAYARAGGVHMMLRTPVVGLERGGSGESDAGLDGGQLAGVRVNSSGGGGAATGSLISARSVILATGGISRPETGSTGDGFGWLRELGHSVRVPEPSLVPMRVKEPWIETLQGVALPDAQLSAFLDGKRVAHRRGKLLFTHFGLSGPLALNMAQQVSEIAQGGPVALEVDLYPDQDGGELDRRLQSLLAESPRQQLRNALGRFTQARLARACLQAGGIDGEQPCHSVSRETRKRIGTALKGVRFRFDGLLGADRAVVSSGGVDPAEIDFRTMQSRFVENLYVTGDLLDFERQSGGYSLQLCWSTGYVAGTAATGLPGDR